SKAATVFHYPFSGNEAFRFAIQYIRSCAFKNINMELLFSRRYSLIFFDSLRSFSALSAGIFFYSTLNIINIRPSICLSRFINNHFPMEANIGTSVQGGGFLINTATPENNFTPEDFNEEQKMIADMCDDFLDKEVLPYLNELDRQQEGLMPSLLDKS